MTGGHIISGQELLMMLRGLVGVVLFDEFKIKSEWELSIAALQDVLSFGMEGASEEGFWGAWLREP